MCNCPAEVRDAQMIHPVPSARSYARPVILTICDCDRRTCPVNGCYAKVHMLNGAICAKGHKS